MKPHRGHYRPLFGVGVGRSPPFLVAALIIGLCILAVSYWRLALQYHDLEEQLKRLIQKRDSLEANQNFINKQLEIREENFSEAKVNLQKKEQEVLDLKKKQDQTEKELGEIKSSLDSLKLSNNKFKTDSAEKDRNLELLRTQNKALEEDKKKLEGEIKELKDKLADAIKNASAQSPPLQKPSKSDPVYNLVNNKDSLNSPDISKNDIPPAAAAPEEISKPQSNKPRDQIVPPQMEPKASNVVAAPPIHDDHDDKLKAQESNLIADKVAPPAAVDDAEGDARKDAAAVADMENREAVQQPPEAAGLYDAQPKQSGEIGNKIGAESNKQEEHDDME